MSNPVNSTSHYPLPPRLAAGALTLLLAACATPHPNKTRDAAAYNVQLGIAYLHQGDVALAKDKLDRALAEAPGSADVHSARAMLFDRMHDPEKADAEFRTSLRLAPHDPQVVNNYAVYLCQNGRTEEGVRRFEEAAHNALYRTPEAAYTNAGVCLRAAKRDEEARADFGRALRTRPNFAEAVYQLTELQFQHGELAPARAGIDAFIGSYEATADLLLLGVRVARAQGDKVGAQHYARRLQMDFPGTDQARALAELDHNPG
jgi:type IV pilus assembly protein PilF